MTLKLLRELGFDDFKANANIKQPYSRLFTLLRARHPRHPHS